MPSVRAPGDRDDADRRVSVLVRLQALRGADEAEERRLLRFLLSLFGFFTLIEVLFTFFLS